MRTHQELVLRLSWGGCGVGPDFTKNWCNGDCSFRLDADQILERLPMKTVGTYEAKTHLSELLEQVQLGETVVITKHGTPVARIMPYALEKAQTVGQVIAGLQSLRQQLSLKGLSIRAMIEEGRRF